MMPAWDEVERVDAWDAQIEEEAAFRHAIMTGQQPMNMPDHPGGMSDLRNCGAAAIFAAVDCQPHMSLCQPHMSPYAEHEAWEAEQQQMGHFGANGPPVALGEMGCYGEMPPLHHMDMEREAWEAEQQMAEQQQMGLFGAPSSTLMGYF